MTYELVKNFITVAKTRNITHTAQVLYVSQSTVSHRLQLLEAELGHPLVFRGKGRRLAALTQWGNAFLPLAEKWLELWQEMEAFRREETDQTLRISCVSSLMACLLRPFFADFVRKHPSIHLQLTVLDTDAIYRMLKDRQIDIGIVLANPAHENVDIHPLLSEKMYCLCHRDMFPDRTRIRPEELDPRGEILLNWNPELKLWHDFRFPSGVQPRMRVNTIEFIEDSMEWEGSWSIVPQTMADYFSKKGVGRLLELESPPPDRVSYVICPVLPKSHTRELTTLFHRELDSFIADYRSLV